MVLRSEAPGLMSSPCFSISARGIAEAHIYAFGKRLSVSSWLPLSNIAIRRFDTVAAPPRGVSGA